MYKRFKEFLSNYPPFLKLALKINRLSIVPIRKQIRKTKLRSFKKGFLHLIIGKYQFSLLLNPENKTVDEDIFLRIYEPKMTEFFLDNLKNDSIFIDVGANIGYYTNLAGAICNKGKIFAFEPIKKAYLQNKESIAKNKFNNIKLFNLALGSKKSISKIYISKDCLGSSTLLDYRDDVLKEEEVKIDKLDNVLKDLKKLDLVKIDAEGFEANVLKGSLKTLKKFHPKIIFEAWDNFYLKKIKQVIQPLNYKIEKIDKIDYLAE